MTILKEPFWFITKVSLEGQVPNTEDKFSWALSGISTAIKALSLRWFCGSLLQFHTAQWNKPNSPQKDYGT